MNSITQLLATPADNEVWDELAVLLDKHIEVLENVDERYTELSELDRKFHFIVNVLLKIVSLCIFLMWFL